MKKIIYLFILALLTVSFGCNKEEVVTDDTSKESTITSKRDFGFGDENGNVSGGNAECPPSTPYDTHIITYSPDWDEIDQEVYRLIFQTNGTLICYIESPTNSQVETWYVVKDATSCNAPPGDPCPIGNSGKGNPPLRNFP